MAVVRHVRGTGPGGHTGRGIGECCEGVGGDSDACRNSRHRQDFGRVGCRGLSRTRGLKGGDMAVVRHVRGTGPGGHTGRGIGECCRGVGGDGDACRNSRHRQDFGRVGCRGLSLRAGQQQSVKRLRGGSDRLVFICGLADSGVRSWLASGGNGCTRCLGGSDRVGETVATLRRHLARGLASAARASRRNWKVLNQIRRSSHNRSGVYVSNFVS